jgi:hypothetical protein
MSPKKTLIIFIVFAVLLGVYFMDQKRVAKKTALEESESRLVTPPQAEITDLALTSHGEKSALKKEGADWVLTAPLKTRTDRATIDGILGELDRAKKKDPFEVADAKLEDYGLKSPAVSVEVQATGKNYIGKFALGADTPDNTETYVRVGDEKKVFTVPNSVKTQLTKTALDLRDKRPLPASATDATSLTVAWSTQTLQLAKRDGQWQLTAPTRGKADTAKVTDLLNELNTAKRSDFIDTATANLAEYGLDKPDWTATLFVAGNDPRTSATARTLKVGKKLNSDNTKHYAQLEGEPGIFALPESVLTKGKPSLDDLRAKEIFSITAADAGKVTFQVRGKGLTVERDSAGQWQLPDDKATRLDQAVVTNKVNTLLNLKAKSFLAAAPAADKSGLTDPNLHLTVSNKAGTTTESLVTGRKAETEDIVYAQVPATGQYLALDWKDPGQFFVTKEELIDKTLFNFSEDTIQKVEITESSKTLTLTKTSTGAWDATGGAKATQIEGSKLTALLYGMTSLAWARRLDPKLEQDMVLIKTQKLENPPKQFVLFDKDGKEVARLGLGGEEIKYAYARTGKDNYIAIDKMRLNSVTEALNNLTGDGPAKSAPAPAPMSPMQ